MTDIQLGATARSVEDVFFLNKIGLQFAEIAIVDPDTFDEKVSIYRATMERTGIYYLCHGPREGDPNDIHSLENRYLPKLFRIFSIMPKLDMSVLTIHFWLDKRFIKEGALKQKIDMLRRITERAECFGIKICLENMSERVEDLSTVFKKIPLLNMTLDLGHAQLLSAENTSYGFMDQFPERIQHIHIHDNHGGTSPADDLHLPVGKGSIDFISLFRHLDKISYEGTMTLELKPFEIEECIDYVKELIRKSSASSKMHN